MVKDPERGYILDVNIETRIIDGLRPSSLSSTVAACLLACLGARRKYVAPLTVLSSFCAHPSSERCQQSVF